MGPPNIDIDYLKVPEYVFWYQCYSRVENESSVNKDKITQALSIMKKYGAFHPSFESLVNSTDERSRSDAIAFYNKRSTTSDFDTLLESLPTRESKAEILEGLKRLTAISIIENNYEGVSNVLNQLNLTIEFHSQPQDLELLIENRYIEFKFYNYIVVLYLLVLFPKNNVSDSMSASIKSLNVIFNPVTSYFKKNQVLLGFDSDTKEVYYYYLMCWFHSIVTFKQADFSSFLLIFYDLLSVSKGKLRPIDILSSEAQLRSQILIMLLFSTLITKPFKELSLLNIKSHVNEVQVHLLDLFDDYASLEYLVYRVMLNLAESNYSLFKEGFDDLLLLKVQAIMGYCFPGGFDNFVRFVLHIVDLKGFIILMSVTKRIPSTVLNSILAFPENSLDDLLLFMSALGLGEIGLGYDYGEDCFYNNNRIHDSLNDDINELNDILNGESVVNIVKGYLLELALYSGS